MWCWSVLENKRLVCQIFHPFSSKTLTVWRHVERYGVARLCGWGEDCGPWEPLLLLSSWVLLALLALGCGWCDAWVSLCLSLLHFLVALSDPPHLPWLPPTIASSCDWLWLPFYPIPSCSPSPPSQALWIPSQILIYPQSQGPHMESIGDSKVKSHDFSLPGHAGLHGLTWGSLQWGLFSESQMGKEEEGPPLALGAFPSLILHT